MANAIQFGGTPKQILFTPTPKKVAFACGLCNSCDTIPQQLSVTFSGITDRGTCAPCVTVLNDTFILELQSTPGQACRWKYIFPEPLCTTLIFIEAEFTPDHTLEVWVWKDTSPPEWDIIFMKDATDPACASWSAVDLPLWFNDTNSLCSASGATCTVTAL